MERVINVTLPEFAFVESSGHDGDTLQGRNVILHIRSASVIEIFEEENFFPKEGAITLRFTNTNKLGVKEYYIAALHCCATLDDKYDKQAILESVITPAARWFCDYCDWEDSNIIQENIGTTKP